MDGGTSTKSFIYIDIDIKKEISFLVVSRARVPTKILRHPHANPAFAPAVKNCHFSDRIFEAQSATD